MAAELLTGHAMTVTAPTSCYKALTEVGTIMPFHTTMTHMRNLTPPTGSEHGHMHPVCLRLWQLLPCGQKLLHRHQAVRRVDMRSQRLHRICRHTGRLGQYDTRDIASTSGSDRVDACHQLCIRLWCWMLPHTRSPLAQSLETSLLL